MKNAAPTTAEPPRYAAPIAGKAIAGIGRVLLWSGGSLWIGHAAGYSRAHAHHAIQITLALSGRIRLSDERGQWREYSGAIVLSHHRHRFDGVGESVAQLFVESETDYGRALAQRYAEAAISSLPSETIDPLIARFRNAYASMADDEALIAIAQRSLAILSGAEHAALSVDPRVTRAIEYLRSRLSSAVTLAQAAEVAHLSPSRFRHLFVAQTGVSFRSYLLWARLESAVTEAMAGCSWTDAAHQWGFADSAHLSRTCRRMFGIAPSMLVRE
jgi:AraC family transcriptional regulator